MLDDTGTREKGWTHQNSHFPWLKPESGVPMQDNKSRNVLDILDAVLDLPASGRWAFLDEACAGDPALREEAEACIRAEDVAMWQPLCTSTLKHLNAKALGLTEF